MRRVVLGIAALASLPAVAQANRAGVVGRSELGCGGAGCHDGAGEPPAVRLMGPAQVAPGATVDFLLRVEGGQTAAGVNLSAEAGTLVPAGDGLRALNGELTHDRGPRAYVEGAADFAFRWRAPELEGAVAIHAAANGVNGNFLQSGDAWALATTTVQVGTAAGRPDAGPVADAGLEPDAGSDTGAPPTGSDDGGCRAAGAAPAPLWAALGLVALRRRRS